MKMSFADKVKFTEPLIDMELPRVSLTKLRKEHPEIIARLYETGEPVILVIDGHRVLLCDPRGYEELERKRHTLFVRLLDLEEALKTETFSVGFDDTDWRELEDLKLKETESRRRLKDLSRDRSYERKSLASIQDRIAAVEASLKTKDSTVRTD
jgi:hypothetical protein